MRKKSEYRRLGIGSENVEVVMVVLFQASARTRRLLELTGTQSKLETLSLLTLNSDST